jgi:hypothetical protein
VYFLLIAHRDLRMFAQKIMQRCGARFLCTSQNEIKPFDFATFTSKHEDTLTENLWQRLSRAFQRSMLRDASHFVDITNAPAVISYHVRNRPHFIHVRR